MVPFHSSREGCDNMTKGRIEKRGTRKRQIKKVILIVTEGARTEPKYFAHFRTRHTNIDIQVVGSKTGGGKTDYMNLLQKAQEYQKKNQLSSANGDSVWVVADGDVDYNNPNAVTSKNQQLNKVRKLAERSDIQIAISNPCFEFWYLLHFRYTTKYMKNYNAVKNELVPFLPEYGKTDDVFTELASKMESAIQNAEKVEKYHLNDGISIPFNVSINPFTEVYSLVKILK